jgi:polar amino acid transport system substrate-binding protein
MASPKPLALALAAALLCGEAAAQTVPSFWDPRRRTERPALPAGTTFRILTAADHPPFNFLNQSGELTGFNVELARAACAELRVTCTVQARAFAGLLPALGQGEGDVVVANVAITGTLRREFLVGEVYLRSPARFAVRRDGALSTFDPAALSGRRIAVEQGSAHEAFLRLLAPEAQLVPGTAAAGRQALAAGRVDALFGDAVALGLWLNAPAGACCELRGGPYMESRFFGDGFAMVFRPGAERTRRAFDHAVQRLAERGVYGELYLRWFPVGLY